MIALIRTEFTKAAARTRTLVIGLLLVGLPTLIVVAINARSDRPDRDGGEGLFRLASQSGLLVPAAVLSATSGFLHSRSNDSNDGCSMVVMRLSMPISR